MIASAQTIRSIMPVYPFHERQISHGMSFGLGPAGYDVRIAESFIMWPGRAVLASTIERFSVPDFMTIRVQDKSTWARQFLSAMNTNGEPGWRGHLTLELVNHSWKFFRIRAGMPIVNIIFEFLDQPTEMPYSGKYQDAPAGPQQPIFQ